MSSKNALLTLQETLALFERAWSEHNASLPDDMFGIPTRTMRERSNQARAAVYFASTLATLHRDPALLGHLSAVVRLFGNDHRDIEYRLVSASALEAIGATVRAHGAHAPDVAALADCESPHVRTALAAALNVDASRDSADKDGSDTERRALLFALARDTNAGVRAAAFKSLGDIRPPWWLGKFSRDPTLGLSIAENQRLTEVFAELNVAVNKGHADRVATLAAELPAPLHHELCRTLIRSAEALAVHHPVLSCALLRAGVEATIEHLLDAIVDDWILQAPCEALANWLRSLDDGVRAPVGRVILDAIFRRRPVADEDEDDFAERLTHVALAATPDSHAEELLDRCLASPEHRAATTGRILLGHVAAIATPPKGLVERAADARRGGYEGLDDDLVELFDGVLLHVPARLLRPLAAAGLASPQLRDRAWALRALVVRCFNTKEDGDRARFLAKLWKAPALRDAICTVEELVPYFTPQLRVELRAGNLTMSMVRAVLHELSRRFGDESGRARPVGPTEAERANALEARKKNNATRRTYRRTVRQLLGPKSLQGPVNRKDIAGYRAALARTVTVDSLDWLLLRLERSANGILPEDRPTLARAVEACRTMDSGAASAIAEFARKQPCEELLPLLRIAHPTTTDGYERTKLVDAYRNLHIALGHPPPHDLDEAEDERVPASPNAATKGTDEDWLEEP